MVERLQRRIWFALLLAIILGIAVGVPIGWMTADFQSGPDDVASIADSYSLNNDLALAKARLRGLSKSDLSRILADLVHQSSAAGQTGQTERLNQFAAAMGISSSPSAATTPTIGTVKASGAAASSPLSLVGTFLPFILVFLIVTLLAAALLVFVLRVLPGLRASPRIRETNPMPNARTAPPPILQRGPGPAAPINSTGQLGRFTATYNGGNDNYDASFSLETAQQDFLGECGMGISETIGEGKPDKVTALDVWLFDKADVRTVTQVVMSEHAYNDETLRAKLAIKGTAVLAEKGKLISLDTQSLHLDGRITEVVYASGGKLPPKSHFEKLTVEIVPFVRESVPA